MTMKREAKAGHQVQVRIANKHGETLTKHASPARRGEFMTGAEYRVNYMGRRQQAEPVERKLSRMRFRKATRK